MEQLVKHLEVDWQDTHFRIGLNWLCARGNGDPCKKKKEKLFHAIKIVERQFSSGYWIVLSWNCILSFKIRAEEESSCTYR